MGVGVRVACATRAQSECEVRERARSAIIQGWNRTAQRARSASVGGVRRVARRKKKKTKLRNLRQTQVLEWVMWRRQIFSNPPTDTGSSIYIYIYIVYIYIKSTICYGLNQHVNVVLNQYTRIGDYSSGRSVWNVRMTPPSGAGILSASYWKLLFLPWNIVS
jgi:hypothetical protein